MKIEIPLKFSMFLEDQGYTSSEAQGLITQLLFYYFEDELKEYEIEGPEEANEL